MASDTWFAPGLRDSMDVVEEEARLVSGARIGKDILDAIPDLALILNDKRQIVAANEFCLKALGLESSEQLLGLRPGEAVHCVHAMQGPHGCGTSVACRQCGAARAILNCLSTQNSVQYECRIAAKTADGDASMEFLAKASYVKVGDHPLVLLVLRDISAEKRKEALERLFFHDVLNTVGGLIGLADMLVTVDSKESNEYVHLIQHLAESVAEEITAHRNLIQAESGTLQVDPTNVFIADLFQEIADGLSHHPVSKGRSIELGVSANCCLRTDRVLIRRIVGNLAKNALEASPKGSVIKLSAFQLTDGVILRVSNPGLMPLSVQSQLFKRSFSTKGEIGRGLGAYSIKLFAERYLKGVVTFDSSPDTGTTFSVALPSLVDEAVAQ